MAGVGVVTHPVLLFTATVVLRDLPSYSVTCRKAITYIPLTSAVFLRRSTGPSP